MPVTTRVVVDDSNVKSYLAGMQAQHILEVIAVEIADTASTIAPDKTGYYKRHMNARGYRTWWRVTNDDPFAHLVEWGSIKNQAYAPIRSAIRQVGVHFVPGRA